MTSSKKELGTDKHGVQKSMRLGDYLGDGVGQLSLTLINMLIGQLTYFYTEKAKVAAAVVAIAILIPKVIDAFSDLFMGKIMDNTNSKSGKCRPWFLRMAIPAALNIVLLFTMPSGLPTYMQVVYILITNTCMSAVIYTAIAVPYSSLMALRTESSEERGTMGIVRTIFNMLSGMLLSLTIIPITNALGGNQQAWIKFSIVIALIAGISLLIAYIFSKENVQSSEVIEVRDVEDEREKSITFKQGMLLLLKNKFWVIMVLTSLINGINYGIMNGSLVWYAKYILGNDNYVSLITGVAMIPTFVGFIIVPVIAKKLGMRDTSILAFVIGIVGCIIKAIAPTNIVAILVGTALFGFSMMPFMSFQGGLLNNCVEYNELKYGYRLVGLTNSVNSFAGKISGGVGGSLIGWILAASGYITGVAAESQPQSVSVGILIFSTYIPMAINVLMVVLLRMYTLEKDYGKIVEELKQKRAERENR